MVYCTSHACFVIMTVAIFRNFQEQYVTHQLDLPCRIYNLRKPKTNIQILQQNVLLKHKHLTAFLRRFAPEVATEVPPFLSLPYQSA